ncbi:MAG: hypothetical protein WAM60_09080 [Candidatus Promineifilaceae bacterium]
MSQASEPQKEQSACTFVVRVWQEWSLNAPRWRGRVIHLQSGKTAAFQNWDQLTAFLANLAPGDRRVPPR